MINDVSDTSFWVAYYRAKETLRSDSMFKDPLAQKLIGERGKKIAEGMAEISKYTEWSVVSRTVIIDRFIENLVKDGVDAVLNLGAGLDTRPYRMNLPENLLWIEVDYPNIINHKNELLKSEKPKCQLTRVQVDLADGNKRREFFNSVLPQSKKVLVITEGVLPYLTPEQVAELSKDIKAQARFTYWIAEYFHKKVYRYLKASVRTLKMKNAPFQFYPEDWFAFFANLGWVPKETRYTAQVAKEFGRTPPMPKIFQLIMRFLPEKVKEESGRMAGYTIFKRS